jgi:AcrR family transcriptional regulator
VTLRDPARRRGRQAEAARNDRLVLEAARHVFTTQGSDAPVAAVAQHAGVGMGSLYRRYGSKEQLLQRLCVLAMEQSIEAAETALESDDPWSGLATYITTCVGFGAGAFAPVAGTIDTTAEMWDTATRAGRLAEKLVERAHSAGVLRADVTALDISLLIEQLGRRAVTPTADDDVARRRLLTIALDGLRARGAEPLPGPPPSWQHYQARWQRR